MTKPKIYLSSPHMGGNEIGYVNEAFDTNWVAPLGPNVNGFETDISNYLSTQKDIHAAALISGTAALHLALKMINVCSGDVVMVQSFTFCGTTNPVNYLDAEIVFIDSELDTWNMCPLALQNAFEEYENKSIFYSIKDKTIFKDKTISIFGGGDSALDWAIELSNTSKVNLIHRRDGFSGAEASVQRVKDLNDQGKLNLFTKYQIDSVSGDKNIESIKIKHDEGEIKEIKCDYVLGFFGLIMQLGPILDWGLNIDKKTVQVNTENFETNVSGIFAIGDICSYPGKLKLILSGFHEGALAARGCFKYAKPDEKLRFEFTTTSKAAQERLGIKK